jgi:glycosyltransferase involved in cell wall biosynthesis
MRRVLLMAHSLDLGGSERQLAEVAAALDRTALEPFAGAFNAGGVRAADLQRAGVPIVEFPLRSFRHPSALAVAASFVRWLRRMQVGLVHPFDVPTVMFAVPLARLARVPVVLSSQRGDRALFPPMYRRVLRLTDHLVDGIVVNSAFMRDLLIRRDGVPAHLLHTCPNGVDTRLFTPDGRTVPNPRAEGGCSVGTVAVLRPEKSIETLVTAFAGLGPSPHRLVIVGDGPCKADLVALTDQLGVADRCRFVPATRDVAPWYRQMDVFVLPSLSESFSNALLEAMACGCSVIASAVGGNLEVIRDGENGRLFRVGDAGGLLRCLRDVLGDPAHRAALSAEAVQTIETSYTTSAAADRMGRLYAALLASRT